MRQLSYKSLVPNKSSSVRFSETNRQVIHNDPWDKYQSGWPVVRTEAQSEKLIRSQNYDQGSQNSTD